MKNKEIEVIEKYLNGLISYPFQHKDKEYILSYIEQLEKNNQCKYRNRCNDIYECSYAEYQEMCNKNMEMALKIEQLENNRDKAIEFIEEIISSTKGVINDYSYNKEHNKQLIELLKEDLEMYKNILNLLKGDSDYD